MTVYDDEKEAALSALFAREGYRRLEPPVLQPAEIFVELSGEDMRRRMFVTQDAAGDELCLRPEYTIPVCRAHLAQAGEAPGAYFYLGPVFRHRTGETGEFRQAGIESIGRADVTAVDAEVLALALEGLASMGIAGARVRLGDMGLLEAVIDALGIAPAAKGKLMRAIVSGRGQAAIAEPDPAGTEVSHAGLLAALEGQDPRAARAFVEDVLAIAGITSVGGRSAGEIAERFLARAAQRDGGLSGEARAILARYLAVSGDPDEVGPRLRALAADAGLGIDAALDAFEERNGFLAARGLDLVGFDFAADFARNLGYYTGFIFEITVAGAEKPLVGGGRYDRLLTHLGSGRALPAIGCSFWLDRIAHLGGAA